MNIHVFDIVNTILMIIISMMIGLAVAQKIWQSQSKDVEVHIIELKFEGNIQDDGGTI